MDTTQLTLVLSSLTALFALIAPWLTAAINNRAEYRKSSAQLFFHARTDAYQNFLSVCASVSYPLNLQDTQKLLDASSRALVLSDTPLQTAISSYTSALLSCPAKPSEAELQALIDAKSELIFAMQADLNSFR